MEVEINSKILHMLSIGSTALASDDAVMSGEVEGWDFSKALDWTMQFLETWQSDCIIMYCCNRVVLTSPRQLYYIGKLLLGEICNHRATVEAALKTGKLFLFLDVKSAEYVEFDVSEDEDDPSKCAYCVTGYGKYSQLAYQLKEFDESTVVYPCRSLEIREKNYEKDENWLKRKLEKRRLKAEKRVSQEQKKQRE